MVAANTIHIATRPGWYCAQCREPWPCAPAKAVLGKEYQGSRLSLSIYMSLQLRDALDDAIEDGGRSPVGGLFDRFMGWLPKPANPQTGIPPSRRASVIHTDPGGALTTTSHRSATAVADPRHLVSSETFDKIARYYAVKAEVTQAYAERVTGQFLVFLKAHADAQSNADFGMLLPSGESYRVVPTRPVDAVWHAALQISEPYTAACQEIAGAYVHHRPILTEAMQDGTAMTYTLAALHATGYQVDMEFWDGESESCCPPNPPQPGRG